MPVKCGPEPQNARDQFVTELLEETANALKDLDAAGGHGEAHTEGQREAMTDLLGQRLVNLVIFEITDAGRDYVRGLSS